MSTSVGKKGKKKWKTIPLDKALPNTLVRSTTSWADEVEDELNEYTLNKISNISLPTAPQASCDLYVDESRIPPNGPYMAYLSNLSFEVVEEDIFHHFKDLKISDVKLPRDSRHDRMMGYGYVQFAEKAGLMSALSQGEATMKGRPVRISLPNDDEKEKERGNRSGRIFGNRDRDQFMDRTDSTDGGSTEWRVAKPPPSQEPDRSGSYQPRSGRREFNASTFSQRERDFERQSSFGKNRDGSDRNRFQNRDRDSNDRRGMGFGRRGYDSDVQFRREQMPERPAQVVEARTRTKIQVLPRSVITETAPVVPSSAIFGGAKPVDTAAREREIEEKMLRESTAPKGESRPPTLLSRSSSQSSLRSNPSRRDDVHGRSIDVEVNKDLDCSGETGYDKDYDEESYPVDETRGRNQNEITSLHRVVPVGKDEQTYPKKTTEEQPPVNVWMQRSAARVGLQQVSQNNENDSQVTKEVVYDTAVSEVDTASLLTKIEKLPEAEKIPKVEASVGVLPVNAEKVEFKEPPSRQQVLKAEVKSAFQSANTEQKKVYTSTKEITEDMKMSNPLLRHNIEKQETKPAPSSAHTEENKVGTSTREITEDMKISNPWLKRNIEKPASPSARTEEYKVETTTIEITENLNITNPWERRLKEKQESDAQKQETMSNNRIEDSSISEQPEDVAKETDKTELDERSRREHGGYRTRQYSNSDNASYSGDKFHSDRRQYNDRNYVRGGRGFRGRGFGNKGFFNNKFHREHIKDEHETINIADDNSNRDGGQRSNREFYNRGNRDGYQNRDKGGYGYRDSRGGYNNDREWKRDGNRNEDNRERRDRRPNANREGMNYDGFDRRPPRNQNYNRDGEANYRGRVGNNLRGRSYEIESHQTESVAPDHCSSQSDIADNDSGKYEGAPAGEQGKENYRGRDDDHRKPRGGTRGRSYRDNRGYGFRGRLNEIESHRTESVVLDDDHRKPRGGPRGRPHRDNRGYSSRGRLNEIESHRTESVTLDHNSSQSNIADNDSGKSEGAPAGEQGKEIPVEAPVVEEITSKAAQELQEDDSKLENVVEEEVGKSEDPVKENTGSQSTTKRRKKKKSKANKELNTDNLPQNNENREQKNKPKNEKSQKEKSKQEQTESKDKSKRIKDGNREAVIAPRYQRTKEDTVPAIKRTNRYEFLQDADSIN